MHPTIPFISCEHAVNTIPPAYHALFQEEQPLLETHRALDIGALAIAEYISRVFNCNCFSATVSRLLIDCNRSLQHPHCFSEFTKYLPLSEKQALIDQYYLPYRQQCETAIQQHIAEGYQVLHLSIHSFTPTLNNITRNADIGLLYDAKRHGEQEITRQWHHIMYQNAPSYRVRMNYPYAGSSDGFTKTLRKHHSQEHYLGIEVEVNQALTINDVSRDAVTRVLSDSLEELMQLL